MSYNREEAVDLYNTLVDEGKAPLIDTFSRLWNVSPEEVLDLVFLEDKIEFFTRIDGGPLRHIVIEEKDFERLTWYWKENDPRHDQWAEDDEDEEPY